jgi:hypothetical protein
MYWLMRVMSSPQIMLIVLRVHAGLKAQYGGVILACLSDLKEATSPKSSRVFFTRRLFFWKIFDEVTRLYA